jgi:hypothetical protein
VNIQDVANQIEKKSGVKPLTLPIGNRFMTRSPDGQMVVIKIGEPWPIGKPDGSIVFSLFQSDDEIRVYTLATTVVAPEKEPVPPTRYTISKHQPAVFAEIMALETFINEVTNEWVMVDEDASSAERERMAVVEFLRTKHANVVAMSLADEIEGGGHLADDEDEEPEVAVASVVTSPVS